MKDPRVPLLAKLVPVLALLLMMSPPAMELDLVPILGEIGWLVVGVLTFKILVWLSPPEVVREHVSRIARGQ
jgi:hypothetical protein